MEAALRAERGRTLYLGLQLSAVLAARAPSSGGTSHALPTNESCITPHAVDSFAGRAW